MKNEPISCAQEPKEHMFLTRDCFRKWSSTRHVFSSVGLSIERETIPFEKNKSSKEGKDKQDTDPLSETSICVGKHPTFSFPEPAV